ncbi:MAG TPA: hypothetical protein VNM14_04870 [Planctomycetota bacterium]|nr:hypothetical protein [Planctomycetota bacterium]
MQKLLLVGWIGAFVCAAAAYPVAGLISSSATEAYLIAAHDPKRVEGEKELFNFDPPKAPKDSPQYRKAVIGIYGTLATDEMTKFVFWPKEKYIHPPELPTITLLPKGGNDEPIQLKTVTFMAGRMTVGASVVGLLLLGVWGFRRRKKTPPAAAPAA